MLSSTSLLGTLAFLDRSSAKAHMSIKELQFLAFRRFFLSRHRAASKEINKFVHLMC